MIVTSMAMLKHNPVKLSFIDWLGGQRGIIALGRSRLSEVDIALMGWIRVLN